MYARVQGYTEFYFYFLLIVYGFSYKRRHMCDTCAHKVFIKTLLANVLFILGIPSAIYIKIKAMRGRDQQYQELDKANSMAKEGRYEEAATLYQQMYASHREHPGLLMNEGLAHLYGGDVHGAMRCFERSLKSCANYLPVMQLVYSLQQQAAANSRYN